MASWSRAAPVTVAILALLFARAATAIADGPLSLSEAISRALAYAPAAAAAKAQSDLTDAQADEARAPLFPSVSANGEYNQAPGYDQTISNRGLTLAQLGLDYTIFDDGRRAAHLSAARYAAAASRLGVDIARAQIVFATTVAYYDLLRAREEAAESQRSVARLGQYVAIVDNLRQSGRAIANDALKVRATRDTATLALAAADAAADHAAIVLGSLIGESDPAAVRVDEVSDLPSPPTGEVTSSPTYQAADRELEAARIGVEAAKAERAPTMKVALTSGWEGIDPPKTFGHHLGASYDGAISVPLFQGGLVRAHIDEARAVQQAASANLRQTELDLKRDFADAVARYQASRKQIKLLGPAQTVADDAFALDWTRFLGGGNVTLFEVLDAYQSAQALRVSRIDDEFSARQAAAQAALILGEPR